MTMTKTLAASFVVLSLGAGMALAKAHDQGVKDGDIEPGTQTGAKTVIDALEDLGVLDGKGVSAVVKKGQRGLEASGRDD